MRYYHFTHAYHKLRSYGVWFLRYNAQGTSSFVILGHFLSFNPAHNLENQHFEKIEKKASRYYRFTRVYHKWKSYDVWLLRYGARQTEFYVIFCHFLPFYPTNNPKNQNFEKIKNIPADFIILHKSTINGNHLMHGSWHMKRDRQIFFFILGHFLLFYPSNNPQNQSLERMKKNPGDIITWHTRTINKNHMMFGSWDMEQDKQNFLSFWNIFCPFTPWERGKSKSWKNEKNAWRHYHFTHCTINEII